LLARTAHAAAADEAVAGQAYARAKRATARFFCDQLLPQTAGLLIALTEGHAAARQIEEEAV
jgi:hypothetical protein